AATDLTSTRPRGRQGDHRASKPGTHPSTGHVLRSFEMPRLLTRYIVHGLGGGLPLKLSKRVHLVSALPLASERGAPLRSLRVARGGVRGGVVRSPRRLVLLSRVSPQREIALRHTRTTWRGDGLEWF